MRKLLLASAAVLGATSWLSANAQTQLPVSYTQGQVASTPSASPPAGANNNNNTIAAPVPGAVANPTPGTVVIHVNGRVTTELNGVWTGLDKYTNTSPVTGVGGQTLLAAGNSFKLQPTSITNFARIYTGVDAMAANGLRYGGAIEIRENFGGQSSTNSNTGSSGYSSSETLFVRRAFGYIAADNIGILRFGQGDGLISLYDNGVTTFQFTPGGALGGGDLQTVFPGNLQIPLASGAVQGAEYTTTRLVYLSPQFYGFDFGLMWAPNTTNGYATGTGNTYNTVLGCSFADSGCSSLSSSTVAGDAAREINQTAVGVRYQGSFSGLGVLAYGVYEFAGRVHYTGSAPIQTYDNLSFENAGLALTYAGFTVGGNWIGGAVNNQLAPKPSGAPNENSFVLGVTYKTGPLTVGVVGEDNEYQGSPATTGHTQRKDMALDVGAAYVIAPGIVGYAEYLYQYRKQNGFNFATGSAGSAYNTIQGQGLEIGTTIYW
ncbi:MAG: porin [Acetobacteraceae bacterium]|nr:porin [Acetobacteraceae bacterium]